MTKFIPVLALVCAFGCDSDNDGLSFGEERANGTDPREADSDGDGLEDGEEVEWGTDPLEEDSDGDGLIDGDEIDNDADPLEEDTDGDGVEDGPEVDGESDPSNAFSWPGDGMWPDMRQAAADDGVVGTSFAYNAVFPNFSAPDRYGTDVQLFQFYGSVILLDFSAGWCGPCKSVAEEAEAMWNTQRDDGFVIIHTMTDGWQGNSGAGETFLGEWADEYGLTFPVLGQGDISAAYNGLASAGLNEGLIPYMVLLNQSMEIDSIYTGSGSEAEISARVTELLGSD